MSALVPVLGIGILVAIAFLFSENRRAVNIRTIAGALAIQLAIGAIVLYIPAGKAALEALSNTVANLIAYANDGIDFLFGPLTGEGVGFVFALKVLPVIIFFSSLISVLYYLRIMQLVIATLGGGLRKLLGTSRAESLSATANIFVGQTEAPLVVKPYIPRMTESELFAVMTGGLASIAGSVLAGYAAMGAELKYLIAACFMAAPGGLLFAKIIKPETGAPDERLQAHLDSEEDHNKPANVLDAAALGASSGLKLALNVGAMLLAFIGLIALANGILGWLGDLVGQPDTTLQGILGYLFAPVAWLAGIPWGEAVTGGSLIGQKLVLNEFVAFANLGELKESLTPHTRAVATFALCGFANFSSIAILIGGLGGIAPSRRKDIARLGLKAVAAATLANLTSAAIASLFLAIGT